MFSIFNSLILLVILLVSMPVKADSILVLGDSISASYGIDPNDGWVSLLQDKLEREKYNYTVINASVSGNTTGDGLARLPALLEQYQPSIVILELGGNDGLRGYPIKIKKKNLQTMIDLSQQHSAKVLLAGIEIPPNYGQRYTDLFRNSYLELDRNNDIAFLPFVLKGIATNKNLMQEDLIHPRAEAQPLILENIWLVLEKIL